MSVDIVIICSLFFTEYIPKINDNSGDELRKLYQDVWHYYDRDLEDVKSKLILFFRN